MKYKLYERLSDFFRSRLFTKTNIAIVAVLSISLNIAMGGVAYKEHKDFESLSALYAVEKSAVADTTAAEATTAPAQTTESVAQTQPSTAQESTQAVSESKETTAKAAASSAQAEQGIYYITDSGEKYHIGSCGYLKNSRNPISLSEAKARGYTPCSRCIK